MTKISNNKRIAKNTLLLYLRMLLSMIVSLYTSRVVLESLGIEDYGIYNVVGGVVAMFTLLSNSLSSSISRFITFALGKNDLSNLKKVFATSLTIQIILILVIFILLETVGVWFLNNKMVIPDNRIDAAFMVFQFSIITFVISLFTTPFHALIIAHERMSAFAYITILDVFFKLFVAYIINYNPIDRLVFYGLILMVMSLLTCMLYIIYCYRNFIECRTGPIFDKQTMRKMFGFAGWNFIGASSAVLRDQGGNILINLFYGPVVNAARGVAIQVNTAVSGFVTNFMIALNPQITKSYAMGDYEYMMKLVFQGARLSYYILLILSLPILVSTPYILNLWLVEVPDHTINFVRLVLIFTMSESLANTLITAMLATGNIRNYQLVVGGCQMMNLPISYILLRNEFPPETIMIVAIIISIVCEFTRLYMLKGLIHLSVKSFLKDVYFNVIVVSVLAAIVPIVLNHYIHINFFSFLIITIVSVISAVVSILLIGCNRDERILVKSYITIAKNKINKR